MQILKTFNKEKIKHGGGLNHGEILRISVFVWGSLD